MYVGLGKGSPPTQQLPALGGDGFLAVATLQPDRFGMDFCYYPNPRRFGLPK